MTHHPDRAAVKAELDRLTADFFRAVSFRGRGNPSVRKHLRALHLHSVR
jgi:hypothetical protein